MDAKSKADELKEKAAGELERLAAQVRSLDTSPLGRSLDLAGRAQRMQEHPAARLLDWLTK